MNAHQSIDTEEKKVRDGRSKPTPKRSLRTRAPRVKQKSVSIHAASAENLEISDQKEVLSMVGKEIASDLGSHVLLGMLAEVGKSMRQVARESGFDVSVLSNIANGKRISGPELWTLAALAEAMELDLQLSFSKR